MRLTVLVRGRVQGVGFRWWTRTRAGELGLTGWARNLADGRVEIVAEGPESGCRALLDMLRGDTPGRVDAMDVDRSAALGGLAGFVIR